MAFVRSKIPTVGKILGKTLHFARNISRSSCLGQAEYGGLQSRRFVAGIKPSGGIHIGNYFGALQRCVKIIEKKDALAFCVADMHSLAASSEPVSLRANIFQTVATAYACGIDPAECTVFMQSSVPEHMELCWILACHSSVNRLAQLPEFQEQSRKLNDIKMGVFFYPVLQAADIILHKATHATVGDDQVPNINFAQTVIQNMNEDYGLNWPICQAYIERFECGKIRSLKDPTKKMSKTDADVMGTVYLTDADEVILDKFKKCTTDCISDIAYDPSLRPGISNLLSIYSLVTDTPLKNVVKEVGALDGNRFKALVGEAVVEHIRPIREQIQVFLQDPNALMVALEQGAEKARAEAQPVLKEIKDRLGLGAIPGVPEPIKIRPMLLNKESGNRRTEMQPRRPTESPVVPIQKLRVEKRADPSAAQGNAPRGNYDANGNHHTANLPEYTSPKNIKFGEKRYRNKY